MFLDTPVHATSTICALIVCFYTAWRGGWPERLAAALIFGDWFITPFLQARITFNHAQAAVFILDGAASLGLGLIALKSDQFWPLWAAGFQVLELLIHLAMLVDHQVRPIAYFIGLELTSYLILLALAVGTWIEGPYSKRSAP